MSGWWTWRSSRSSRSSSPREAELSDPQPPVLISAEAIQARVSELAEQISGDYAGVERLLLVGVLRGAFIFLADLARQLTVPVQIDFIAVSSYGDSAESGAVRLVLDVR